MVVWTDAHPHAFRVLTTATQPHGPFQAVRSPCWSGAFHNLSLKITLSVADFTNRGKKEYESGRRCIRITAHSYEEPLTV